MPKLKAIVTHGQSLAATRTPRYVAAPTWGTVRRFENADTDRLNQAHWLNADDSSVNNWLQLQLATLRARSAYEARNNSTLLGVINTHCDDIVGSDGPSLQVISDNDQFNRTAERVWQDWFAAPTPRRNVSGASLLKLWIRSLWKCGEYLAQLVTDPAAPGPVKMRLQPIHPRRLSTPVELTGDPNVFMGIRFDGFGRPTQYWIASASPSGQSWVPVYKPVPADDIIHEFIVEEEDQIRGCPWAASCLDVAADMREYDARVQDSAQQIADQSAMLYTDHPDAQLWQLPEETTVQRRTVRMLPPGWKPFVYPATQPAVQYPDYRAERLRELGRPVGMPLLLVRLDASSHSYSSARLDTQVYRRAVHGLQVWISGSPRSAGTLNRCFAEVIGEAKWTFSELRSPPPAVLLQWTWPVLPHVDPEKERKAQTIALQNNTETITGALAAEGKTLEAHLAEKQREMRTFAQMGVPYPSLTNQAPAPQKEPDDEGDAGAEEDEEEPANADA